MNLRSLLLTFFAFLSCISSSFADNESKKIVADLLGDYYETIYDYYRENIDKFEKPVLAKLGLAKEYFQTLKAEEFNEQALFCVDKRGTVPIEFHEEDIPPELLGILLECTLKRLKDKKEVGDLQAQQQSLQEQVAKETDQVKRRDFQRKLRAVQERLRSIERSYQHTALRGAFEAASGSQKTAAPISLEVVPGRVSGSPSGKAQGPEYYSIRIVKKPSQAEPIARSPQRHGAANAFLAAMVYAPGLPSGLRLQLLGRYYRSRHPDIVQERSASAAALLRRSSTQQALALADQLERSGTSLSKQRDLLVQADRFLKEDCGQEPSEKEKSDTAIAAYCQSKRRALAFYGGWVLSQTAPEGTRFNPQELGLQGIGVQYIEIATLNEKRGLREVHGPNKSRFESYDGSLIQIMDSRQGSNFVITQDLASKRQEVTEFSPHPSIKKRIQVFDLNSDPPKLVEEVRVTAGGQVLVIAGSFSRIYKSESQYKENPTKPSGLIVDLQVLVEVKDNPQELESRAHAIAIQIAQERNWPSHRRDGRIKALSVWLAHEAQIPKTTLLTLTVDFESGCPDCVALEQKYEAYWHRSYGQFTSGTEFKNRIAGDVLAVTVPISLDRQSGQPIPFGEGEGILRKYEFLGDGRFRYWETERQRSGDIVEGTTETRTTYLVECPSLPSTQPCERERKGEPAKEVVIPGITGSFARAAETLGERAVEALPGIKQLGEAASWTGSSLYHGIVAERQGLAAANRGDPEYQLAALAEEYRAPAVRGARGEPYFINAIHTNPDIHQHLKEEVRRHCLQANSATLERALPQVRKRIETDCRTVTDTQLLEALERAYSYEQVMKHGGTAGFVLGGVAYAGESAAEGVAFMGAARGLGVAFKGASALGRIGKATGLTGSLYTHGALAGGFGLHAAASSARLAEAIRQGKPADIMRHAVDAGFNALFAWDMGRLGQAMQQPRPEKPAQLIVNPPTLSRAMGVTNKGEPPKFPKPSASKPSGPLLSMTETEIDSALDRALPRTTSTSSEPPPPRGVVDRLPLGDLLWSEGSVKKGASPEAIRRYRELALMTAQAPYVREAVRKAESGNRLARTSWQGRQGQEANCVSHAIANMSDGLFTLQEVVHVARRLGLEPLKGLNSSELVTLLIELRWVAWHEKGKSIDFISIPSEKFFSRQGQRPGLAVIQTGASRDDLHSFHAVVIRGQVYITVRGRTEGPYVVMTDSHQNASLAYHHVAYADALASRGIIIMRLNRDVRPR